MKRRDFLINMNTLILLGLRGGIPGLTLIPQSLFADSPMIPARRFFLMIRANGGWDVTLGLDPKVHANGSTQEDMFIEYRPDQILRAGNLQLAPACTPLIPHARDLAVINGIFMSANNVSHEGNSDHISTGDPTGHSADMPIELGLACGGGPLGVIFSGLVKSLGKDIQATDTLSVESMVNSADLSGIKGYMGEQAGDSPYLKSQLSWINSSNERAKLSQYLNANGLRGNSTDSLSDSVHKARVIASAFASGTAFQGQMVLDPSTFDSHSNHADNHLRAQTEFWGTVASIFDTFKKLSVRDSNGAETSLFDQTTFLVVSEFSRTPALNASKGKDHNPLTNSALLAGAGIRGGQAFGTSHLVTRHQSELRIPRHASAPIDFTTGIAAKNKQEAKHPNFQFIYPGHLLATVAEVLGADRRKLRTLSDQIQPIKAVTKS